MNFSLRNIVLIGVLVIGVLFVVASPMLVENLDASHIMVIQSPVAGELTVYTEPGLKYQGFGKVTTYPRRAQFVFPCAKQEKDPSGKVIREYGASSPLRVRFSDGGHADMCGAVSWEMPLKPDMVINVHKFFGSEEGIENQGVSRMLDAAVYLAGPMMTSTESSGERRADLVQLINDQAINGVYVTEAVQVKVKDTITGIEKTVTANAIVRDAAGQPKRQQGSILAEFNIRLLPISINEIRYDKIVEDQIGERQRATTAVQISQANAARAKQDAITTEEQGKATAMKAKWDQEAIKVKAVTVAEQNLAVATLGAREAEQFKRDQILRGEGEAERKKLVMAADGALDPKLKAYIEVNTKYASAIEHAAPGAWTPSVVMGNTGTGVMGHGAQALVEMLTAKTAKELGLDMSVTAGNTSKK